MVSSGFNHSFDDIFSASDWDLLPLLPPLLPGFFHVIMIVGMIFLLLNPKGIRLLFFVFFSYLLIDIFTQGSYLAADMHSAVPSCILSLPLYWMGVSVNTIVYIHLVLYALLAYFSFNHSFLGKYTLESESEILDDLE